MALPEAKVVKPINGVLGDNGPQFQVSNAEIRDAKTGELTSILEADGHRPLTLTGRLAADQNNIHFLINPKTKNPSIEITNITRHAYAEVEDDEVGYITWGAGQSGWFEVIPNLAYKAIHETSLEAVQTSYFMQDQYSWGENITHLELFRRYAETYPEKAKNAKEAAQLFYKHRVFLAQEMKGRKRSVRWPETPLYQHLTTKFSDLFGPSSKSASKAGSIRQVRQGLVSNVNGNATHGRTTRTRSVSSDAKMVDVPDNVSTTSSRRRDFTPTGPSPEDLEGRAKALWKFILDTYKKLSADPDDLELETFGTELHTWYVFDDVSQASDYLSALASQLIALMDRSRLADWTETGIYQSLQNSKLPAVTRKRVLAITPEERSLEDVERVRRLHAGEPLEDDDTSENSSDNSSARPKSALRPKGSKFADKGAKRHGKHLRGSRGSDDDGDRTMEDIGNPTKRKVEPPKRPGRPRKRKTSDMVDMSDMPGIEEDGLEDVEEIELPLRRKLDARKSSPKTNAFSRRKQPVDNAEVKRSKIDGEGDPPLPSPSIRAPIIKKALPSEAADGPADTWLCNEDGCTHKVFGASKAFGKSLVREHIEEHENLCQTEMENETVLRVPRAPIHPGALDLVMREQEMSNLPVSNLAKRIRELAEKQGNGPTDYPTPIERRY